MAQDFRAAFGLGESDKTIATLDAVGVSLAAIKALNSKVTEKESRIQDLQDQVEDQQTMLNELSLRLQSLESSSR